MRSLNDFESFFLKQIRTFDSVNYVAWANERGEYIDVVRLNNGKLNISVVDHSTNRQFYIYQVNSQGQRGRLLQNSGKYDPRTRPWYKAAFAAKRATWSPIYVWFDKTKITIDAVLPLFDVIDILETSITKQKPIEATLREADRRWRSLLNNVRSLNLRTSP